MFVKLRSVDEKNTYSIDKFREVENAFYESRHVITENNKGVEYLSNFVYENFFKIFQSNITTNEGLINNYWNVTQQELKSLKKELPKNHTEKIDELKKMLKVITKYIQDMMNFNKIQLVHNIEMLNGIPTQQNYNDKYNLNIQLSELIKEGLIYNIDYESIIKNIKKRVDKQIISKNELELIIFESSKKIIDNHREYIQCVLKANIEINTQEIEKKIDSIFRNILEQFQVDLYGFFQEIIEKKTNEVLRTISLYDQMEVNLFYHSNKTTWEYFNQSFTKIVQNNYIFDKFYSDFIKISLEKVVIEKIKKTLDHYIKVFAYEFYTKLKEELNDIPMDTIIEKLNLKYYEEREDIKTLRQEKTEEIIYIRRIQEIMLQVIQIITKRPNLNSSNLQDLNLYKSVLMHKININSDSNDDEMTKYEYNPDEYDTFQIIPHIKDNQNNNNDFINLDLPNKQDNTINLNDSEVDIHFISSRDYSFTQFKNNKSNEMIQVLDTTDQIVIYNMDRKSITQVRIQHIPNHIFAENNRYINIDNSVYVSGGNFNGGNSTLFYEIIRTDNSIIIKADLPVKTIRYSLIYSNDLNGIILVGGSNSKNCYIYYILDNKWDNYSTLNVVREDPSLFLLNNNTLFCLGGMTDRECHQGKYMIEYKVKFSDWKLCELKIDEKITPYVTQIAGVGIIPIKTNQHTDKLLLLGGYNIKTYKDEYNTYELHLTLTNDNTEYELSLHSSEIKYNYDGWFPENNFINYNSILVNFTVDGHVILYNQENSQFDLIEFEYKENIK